MNYDLVVLAVAIALFARHRQRHRHTSWPAPTFLTLRRAVQDREVSAIKVRGIAQA
jgi:hypothetical protein